MFFSGWEQIQEHIFFRPFTTPTGNSSVAPIVRRIDAAEQIDLGSRLVKVI
jgi:hypothetical protein